MHSDETDRRIARQEFLEAVVGGLGGSACAPMPGTFIEMLEIAAFERRRASDGATHEPVVDETLLTARPNSSRMPGRWLKLVRAAIDVAGRFTTGHGARRLPI